MNNVTAPPTKTPVATIKKLVNALEKPSAGQVGALMSPPPSPVDIGRGSTAITPERPRVQFKFWMNIAKDDEFELSMEMMLLKSRRKFATTIKDGLRLMLDLRAGKIDVLLELFPFVRDAVGKEIMR
jgi:hypothetical protein